MTQTRTLAIGGMSCQGCVRHVTRALNAVPGVTVRSVEVGSAEVEFDPAVVPEENLLKAVQEAGYTARAA